MAFTKYGQGSITGAGYGQGEILPESDQKKLASTWTDKDSQELAQENAEEEE